VYFVKSKIGCFLGLSPPAPAVPAPPPPLPPLEFPRFPPPLDSPLDEPRPYIFKLNFVLFYCN